MAIPKRVKEGGIYYQGFKIDVLSASGQYPIAITPSTTSCAILGLSVTPDSNGSNDYFNVEYVATTGSIGGTVIKQIATNLYNIGGGVTVSLDFSAMQLIGSGESLRVTYVNTASVAMPVFITVEAIK